jgi:hypothetical protein
VLLDLIDHTRRYPSASKKLHLNAATKSREIKTRRSIALPLIRLGTFIEHAPLYLRISAAGGKIVFVEPPFRGPRNRKITELIFTAHLGY